MKNRRNAIFVLILTIILVPIIIYLLSNNIYNDNFKTVYHDILKKMGVSETSSITSSIESIVANDDFQIGTTGSYTWGSFEKVYDDWSLPYTVTQDQYGIDSNKVGYCCYLGWTTIKGADKNLANEIDEQGRNHAYEAWTNGLRLANRDGHRQRIECEEEATFHNLAKSIAYALSGLNGKYNNCERQNLIWNSHIWAKGPYNADKVVEGELGNASKIDTLGNVSLHFNDGNARTDKLVRAQQFATWAYQVLGNDNNLDLKLSPEKENEPESDSSKKLHVEADQATLSYWIGPYKLDLTDTAGGSVINDENAAAGTSDQTLGDLVYKEIIRRNVGETSANVFIKTRFRLIAEYTDGSIDEVEVKRNGDGTIAAQTDTSKRIVLTDSHGAALPYGVPTFGSEFYIRYYVSNPMKTLKYITPKIEASYLNNSMAAGGIKVHSTKVSYSIHYAICNYQDKSLRQYFTAQGYSAMDLGDFGDTSALREAYYYNTERNKTANIQDGITAVENIVKDSNAGPSNPKVTWYDDTPGGWSGEEDDYAAYWGYDAAGRCDGIIAFDTDYEKYVGGSISVPHERFMFFSEFNSLDELYNCLTENYLLPIWVGIEGVTGTNQCIGKSWHKAESLFHAHNDHTDFQIDGADGFSHPEKMVSKNCGCDKDSYCPGKDSHNCCGNDKCSSCDCNKNAEFGQNGYCGDDDNCKTPCDCGDDCDCGQPFISVPARICHCGCSCKYRYEAFEFRYNKTIYYRDVIDSKTRHVVKRIGEKDEDVVKIPASDYVFENQQEALDAIKRRVDAEIRKVLDNRKKEFDQWFNTNTYPALYVPYGSERQPYTKPFVEEYGQEQMQKVIYNLHTEGESTWKNSNYTMTKKEINEYLGGNVNENVRGIESRDGVQKDDIWQGAGIEVTLIDLGPQGNYPKPTAPTKPTKVEDPPEPKKPNEPTGPGEEPKRSEAGEFILPRSSPNQWGHQCACYGAINMLCVMGYDVDPSAAIQWFVNKGYYGADDNGPYPSRAHCIEFVNYYIATHLNEKTKENSVRSFYDSSVGDNTGYYLNEAYIRSHLPQNVGGKTQFEAGKTYSTFEVPYEGSNPGINNSASHYVTFSEYRINGNGELEVFVLNSAPARPSQWMKWSDISKQSWNNNGVGMCSGGALDPSNSNDYGVIESTYKPTFVNPGGGNKWDKMTDEEFNKEHRKWELARDKYEKVDLPAYQAALAEYNRLYAIYQQQLREKENYDAAMRQYNSDYQTYQANLAVWEQTAHLNNNPSVVKITLTDENGNYGFQRLNPLHTYKLQFRYDGLEFIDDLGNPTSMDSTTDISDTIKNRNTAAEIDQYTQSLSNDPRSVVQGRSQVNDNFEKIDASNINYTGNAGQNKAYGWYTKLRGNNTKFIEYNNPELEPNGGLDNNVGAMRFVDAYYLFKKNAIDNAPKIRQGNIGEMIGSYVDIESGGTITYDNIIKGNLPGILASKGVSTGINENNIEHGGMNEYDETTQVSNFIYDSLVVAETKIHFPDNGPVKFFLEDVGSGNTNDANNKTTNNTDRHNNYHHEVCDNPFPVNRGSGKRRVNSLYNNERTNNGSTINNRDQARNIDLRIKRREEANLLIAMDLTQVTLTVNGQKEIYKYGDLDLNEGNVAQLAKVSARAGQELQNYNKSYSRIITESMFLYKGSLVDEGSGDSRDLSMYITYKIIIKNSGKVNLDVGYIVDHYDAYYLQWKSEDQAKIKTIVGDENCTAEVTPNDDGNHAGGSHPYNSDKKQLAAGGIGNMHNEVFIKVGKLAPEETKTMTITFEQQKDPTYKRLKINQDIETGALLIGDKNVVEIDGYTSTENDIFQRGLITRHSNIGNLCPVDFYDNGNKAGGLIDDKTNPVENRVEIDTASGPNLVIYIPTDGYIPCISGYTYEDVRNKQVENAVIGNGKYKEDDKDYRENDTDPKDDKDKKIKGVTVQLVELVKEVDAYGLSSSDTANYIKEKIWGTTTFTLDAYMGTDNRRGTDSVIYVPNTTPLDKDVHRYSSGKDKAQVILNVNSGYLNVENKKDENGNSYVALSPEEGMYRFVNVPPGVFVVRFIYGDTTQTMLVKNNGTKFGNEVNELLTNKGPAPTTAEDSVINYEDSNHDQYMFLKGDSDGYISKEGLNEKSYNGNDYKSTIYQADLGQEGSYKGVNAYTDYEKQNFTNTDGYEMTQVTDGDALETMYYYNIAKADSSSDKTISDAKDIYSFRQNSDNYAKGYISSLTGNLKNDHYTAQMQALMLKYMGETNFENAYNNPNAVENGMLVGENGITLRNYRNEIMNSFEQIGTYTSRNVKPESVEDNKNYFDANRQVEMLKELMKYTRMVAQTGIINFEVEYTVNDWSSAHGSDKEYVPVDKLNNGTPESNNLPSNNFLQNERTKRYHIRDLNLGLVERPEAQIRLNKNAANVKIALSNGETLFDTNKSVNNMFYAKHKAHTYNFSKSFRLQSTKVSTNSLSTPELIQAYMDDELIENAILEVKYVYTYENVGEVDYLDKQFYYTGKEEHANDLTNVSRTNIDEVLDYVPNKITFNAAASNELDELRVKTSSEKTKLNSGYEKSFWQVKSIIPSENNGIIDSEEYYKTYIYPFGVSTIDAQRDQTPISETALPEDQLTGEYLHGLGGNATTGAAAGNLNADLVNREYFDRITSYSNGSILTTDRLSTKKYNNDNYCSIQRNGGEAYTFGLIPKAKDTSKEEDYKIETPLLLSVTMSRDDDLVYPNLIEAVRVSNSVGRRCKYSTVGNQPMANQNYASTQSSHEEAGTELDKYSVYSPVDVVTPVEIDADSSQSVRILPPTGFNKNNSNLYFALIGGMSIIIVSILILKVSLEQKKRNKKANISRWK